MSKTRAQLVAMAADEMGIVGTGQSLSDEDADKIDSRFDGLIAELAVRGIYEVDDETEIADEASEPLAICLAFACATPFGLPKDYVAREDAESRLRIITRRIASVKNTLTVDSALSGGPSVLTYQRWLRGG